MVIWTCLEYVWNMFGYLWMIWLVIGFVWMIYYDFLAVQKAKYLIPIEHVEHGDAGGFSSQPFFVQQRVSRRGPPKMRGQSSDYMYWKDEGSQFWDMAMVCCDLALCFQHFPTPFQSESLLETETGFAQAEKNPLDCNTSPDGGAESFFNRSSRVASANGARARCWLSSRGCQVETRSLTIKSGGWTNTKSLANKCRSEASFTLRWKHLEANNRQQASVSKILLTNMFMIFHGISWFIARFQKCVQTRTCIYDIYVAIILPSWILWQTARFCKTPKYWHKEFGSKRPT